MAWKATDASLADMVDGIFDGVVVDVLAVLVGRRRRGLQRRPPQGLDSRFTTKHVGGTVVVVGGGRAIAWEATDALVDDTVDVTVDVSFLFLVVGVVKSMLRKLASSSAIR